METKSLIDSDISFDSVVEVDVDQVTSTPSATISPIVCSSTNISLAMSTNKEAQSDVPSLVDASDCEDTHSQASVSSSLLSLREDSHDVQGYSNDSRQSYEEEKTSFADASREEVVLKVVSNETTDSFNTVKTSNMDIQCSSHSQSDDPQSPVSSIVSQEEKSQNHQLETKGSVIQNQNQRKIETDKTVTIPVQRIECGTLFEKSLIYVTDFFSCSTPNMGDSANCCSGASPCDDSRAPQDSTTQTNENGINTSASATSSQNQTKNDAEDQLQKLQTCIEVDILNLMGCSAEGAQNLIDSLGESIFHSQHQCQWSQHDGPATEPVINKPKIRNRNVYVRQKAVERIRRLRQGGLSRHFSLAQVYTFLAEEADDNSSRSLKQTKKTKSARGGLMPLSKRPKSLSDDKRQTSLGNATTSFEPTILTTRSHEQTKGERDTKSDTQPAVGCYANQRFFARILQKSCIRRSSSLSSEESNADLYYDSDPGTHDGNRKLEPSELRNVVDQRSSRRSKTISVVDEQMSDLRRFESNMSQNNKSMLQSINIHSFDINDSVSISQLIKVSMTMKTYPTMALPTSFFFSNSFDFLYYLSLALSIYSQELITSNFLFIWHPENDTEESSWSSNAPPHRIKAWFEMGSCLKKALLQPKFVWRSNDNFKHSTRLSKMKSIHSPESVELLNIVRIVVPLEIDRRIHPFVKKDCVFTIVTNTEEEFTFEAATQDERDKFVFAFKVMVARLASKIIVGDKDVFDEFFTPLGITKNRRRRRRKTSKTITSAGSDVYLVEVKEVVEVESDSSSESDKFCKVFTGTVDEESKRKDELWGT
jgi:hypothetical protein